MLDIIKTIASIKKRARVSNLTQIYPKVCFDLALVPYQ
jgi:hypothetical protein